MCTVYFTRVHSVISEKVDPLQAAALAYVQVKEKYMEMVVWGLREEWSTEEIFLKSFFSGCHKNVTINFDRSRTVTGKVKM